MSGTEIGVAFIGAGAVAEMHGRGVAANPGIRLIGVYDPATEKAVHIARKFGGGVFRSLDEALEELSVEAVHVLTPHPYHVPTAVKTKGGIAYTWNEASFEDTGGPGWGMPCYEDSFFYEIEHFVNACIRGGQSPLSTLEDAADALRIIEAAEQAADGRRSVEIAWEEI